MLGRSLIHLFSGKSPEKSRHHHISEEVDGPRRGQRQREHEHVLPDLLEETEQRFIKEAVENAREDQHIFPTTIQRLTRGFSPGQGLAGAGGLDHDPPPKILSHKLSRSLGWSTLLLLVCFASLCGLEWLLLLGSRSSKEGSRGVTSNIFDVEGVVSSAQRKKDTTKIGAPRTAADNGAPRAVIASGTGATSSTTAAPAAPAAPVEYLSRDRKLPQCSEDSAPPIRPTAEPPTAKPEPAFLELDGGTVPGRTTTLPGPMGAKPVVHSGPAKTSNRKRNIRGLAGSSTPRTSKAARRALEAPPPPSRLSTSSTVREKDAVAAVEEGASSSATELDVQLDVQLDLQMQDFLKLSRVPVAGCEDPCEIDGKKSVVKICSGFSLATGLVAAGALGGRGRAGADVVGGNKNKKKGSRKEEAGTAIVHHSGSGSERPSGDDVPHCDAVIIETSAADVAKFGSFFKKNNCKVTARTLSADAVGAAPRHATSDVGDGARSDSIMSLADVGKFVVDKLKQGRSPFIDILRLNLDLGGADHVEHIKKVLSTWREGGVLAKIGQLLLRVNFAAPGSGLRGTTTSPSMSWSGLTC